MIIGGFAAGVRILLEKGPSRHHVLEDQEIPEKYKKIIFRQKTEETRRRRQEEPQGGLTHKGRGPTPGRAGYGEATLAHYCHRSFMYIVVPENLSEGGSEIDTAASAGRKTPDEGMTNGPPIFAYLVFGSGRDSFERLLRPIKVAV
jgi:hypothetical protein